jgi:dethiobiotin synthetase
VTRRVYVVGSDTGVGKTTLSCALLRRARDHQLCAVPFKPAQSGGEPGASDIDRLLRAASLPPEEAVHACPFRFDAPLAPGLAERPEAFLGARTVSDALSRTQQVLDAWILRHRPDLVIIEGAGGLHVPMPGGTWQAAWIGALADHVVIVGRAGLGTINHTLLTIDAVRTLPVPLAGFYLSDVSGESDPSRRDNAAVIAHARRMPHLGTVAHGADESSEGIDLLAPLLAACV